MLRIGTRGSKLAMVQAHWVADQLQKTGAEVSIEIIKTKGDVVMDRFDKIEGKGFFTAEIEYALHEGDIDVAVHCLKDLPTQEPPQLKVTAITEREDPRDVLISKQPIAFEKDTPQLNGLRLGTSSNRRVAGLKDLAPEASFEPIRGNVQTRLAKMEKGDCDVAVLAQAGINRLHGDLDLSQFHCYSLDPQILVPAPGQGALALQIREGENIDLSAMHHEWTARCCTAERRILNALEGGCQLPLGVYVSGEEGNVRMQVFKGSVADEEPTIRLDFTDKTPEAAADRALALLQL
jgi:hydroxymethylbilane synthase